MTASFIRRLSIVLFVMTTAAALPRSFAAEPTPPPQESAEQRDARMKWWREARFGMFIHWGISSVPAGIYKGKDAGGAGEWIMNRAKIPVAEYEQFAAQFNPTKFDADEWARIAADAGMKYIVITSKHHDGFCMWDSKVSAYDIADATPFKRDVMKELAEACRKRGIRFCFYHSIMDWHHPDAKGASFAKYRDEYLKPQLKELLTNYGPIGVLWFDGEWIGEWTDAQGEDLYNLVRTLQPQIIVNNRVGKGRKGMDKMSRPGGSAGDFDTPEQRIPGAAVPGYDWESCMTINNTWGYKANDKAWKPAQQLIRNLIDIASKGGNYLLNVGPTAEGVIPKPSVESLQQIGKWLKVNGEAIYGTTASPFEQPKWGRFTRKPGRIYAHVFDWPKNQLLHITTGDVKITSAWLLSDPDGKPLTIKQAKTAVTISLPLAAPDPIATVIVLQCAKEEAR